MDAKEALLNKWEYPEVIGEAATNKPGIIPFKHYNKAIDMLEKHIKGSSKIVTHNDVDCDGIGCAYIIHKLLKFTGARSRACFMINKEKEHGIAQKHVDFINDSKFDFVIITDSSSNELELIKQIKCDVLVVDHHDLTHNELIGKTAGGDYVIVTNMVSNYDIYSEWLAWRGINLKEVNRYTTENRMSCGLVLYELFRIYCLANYQTDAIIEDARLYQWVAITLFSDAISMLTQRNQWYVDKTVYSLEIEPTLKVILENIDKEPGRYVRDRIDKSFINFVFAPLINSAIRAGEGAQVLDLVLTSPHKINTLHQYRELQNEIVNKALALEGGILESEDFILKNITNSGVNKNYCGLISTKMTDMFKKNTLVYVVENGIAKGSFRGIGDFNYREIFSNYGEDIYAQGHPPAFGFKIPEEKLIPVMLFVRANHKKDEKNLPAFTIGSVAVGERGEMHIENMKDFIQSGNLYRMAVGNAKVASKESIKIVCNKSECEVKEKRGKTTIYDCFGVKCKALRELNGSQVGIYPEYSGTNGITLYLEDL